MLLLRKIVFYAFVLVYLILCPLMVARLLGFVINPLTHRFVKTGLVYISTNPPNATVYIDGRLARQKSPTVVRDLTPGKHFIRIEFSGYKDWERAIPIIKKKATVLANVLLIPQIWPIQLISPKSYQNIYITDDGILIASNPVLKDIDIYHTYTIEENFKEQSSYAKESLFALTSVYADGQLINLYHAQQSSFILLEARMKDKEKFLWVNLKETPPRIEDITDLFPEIPSRITWNKNDHENIFAQVPGKTYRINIKDKAIYPQNTLSLPYSFNQNITGDDHFLINDKNDLLIREGNRVRVYPKENFGPSEAFDITRSKPSTNMYFEEKNGELFYLDDAESNLHAAQILPFHSILNIPIPERLQFKSSS